MNFRRTNRSELLRNLVEFGYNTLALALGLAVLIGLTVIFQAGVYAEHFGARTHLGWASGYAVLWEFGPLLLGLLMSARMGSKNAAELALLKNQGQIDAWRGLGLDPFSIFICPRVLAIILSFMLLACITFSIAIGCESIAAFTAMKLPIRVFWENLEQLLRIKDLLASMIKSLLFAVSIALLSTFAGLRTTPGALGVGRASSRALVTCCVSVFGIDFLATPWLSRMLS